MFHSYTKIETVMQRDLEGTKRLIHGTFRDPAVQYLKDLQWEVQEKVDGCLQGKTPILMADGSTKTIRSIVEDGGNPEVWGMDENGKPVVTKVLAVHDNGMSCGNWLNVTVTAGGYWKNSPAHSIKCTSEHKFYIGNGEYARADELRPGDTVYMFDEKHHLTYIQEQVLIGLMIGDGSLNNRSVAFSHKEEHSEYVEYVIGLLGQLGGTVTHGWKSGYGTEMCRARSVSSKVIDELCQQFRNDGRNVIPDNVTVGPLALAIAYMDDGSLQHNDLQEDRCVFCLSDYDEESVDAFVRHLEKLGVSGSKQYAEGKGFSVRLNAKDAFALQTIICPYVCDCMQYKLSEGFRGQHVDLSKRDASFVENVIVRQKVMKVEPFDDKPHRRYDLTTGTHNYIANGIVVHNCNIQIWFDGNRVQIMGRDEKSLIPDELMEVLKAKFLNDDTEQLFEQMFPPKLDEDGNEKLVEVSIFGEGIGPKIQKVGPLYGSEYRFLVFDVRVSGVYLEHSSDIYKQVVDAFDLETVPDLPDMTIEEAQNYCAYRPQAQSLINPKAPMEGLVLRPKVRLYNQKGERLIVKIKCRDCDPYNAYAEKYAWIKRGKAVVYMDSWMEPGSRCISYRPVRCTIRDIMSPANESIEKVRDAGDSLIMREIDTGETYITSRLDLLSRYDKQKWEKMMADQKEDPDDK